MTQDGTLLFVYGTLKRGDVRSPLLDRQTFLGEAKTAPHYRLFNVGQYPALVEAAPLNLPGRSIGGELWQVNAPCLARLDEEEGVDDGLYARTTIELTGPPGHAMTYLYNHPVDGLDDCGTSWPITRA